MSRSTPAQNRARYLAHQDERRAYTRAYYRAHREEILAKLRAERAAHPKVRVRQERERYPGGSPKRNAVQLARHNAEQKIYRLAHREERSAYDRAWSLRNAARRKECGRAYYLAHPENYAAVSLRGEVFRIKSLPSELQPLALSISRARALIREAKNA